MTFISLALDGFAFTAAIILLGQSLVVVHRGSGVANFATVAIGIVGTYTFYNLWPAHGVPWPVALVIGLGVSAVLGAAINVLIMRPLANSSLTMRVVATLAVMTLVIAMGNEFLAPGGIVRLAPAFYPHGQIHLIGSLNASTGRLILMGVALSVTIGLALMQKWTKFGLATIAVCEDPVVAAGMGWSPNLIATLNWALGSAVSAAALILLAPISGLSVDSLSLLIVPALAAALIGRFDSLLWTLVGGAAIGIGEAEVGLLTTAPGWAEATPLLLIVLILVLRRPKKIDRSGAAARSPLVGNGRIGIRGLVAFVGALILVLMVPIPWTTAIVTTLAMAICLLSIVVLTGYTGQLSLAQFGLAGFSAFSMALFGARYGLPLWAAMILGVLVTLPVAMVVALPALRTQGVTLAIATLSMVVVIEVLLLANPTANSWMGDGALPALNLFGIPLDMIGHPRSFATFVLIIAGLLAVITANIRRSSVGRRMLAIRANPQAAAALGVSPTATKAHAFAVSAVIAGICGVLLEAELLFANFGQFKSFTSIQMVLQGMFGGIGFVPGAFAGSTASPGGIGAKTVSLFVSPSNWLTIISALLVLGVVLQAPDGLVPFQLRLLRKQFNFVCRIIRPHRSHLSDRRSDVAQVRGGKKSGVDQFRAAVDGGRVRPGTRKPADLFVSGVSVAFGGVVAVRDVSLHVAPGEIVGLIGPNGAGKSTLIDAVTGAVSLASGTISLGGNQIDRMSITRRARLGVARSFQSLELFEDMTIGENLLVAASTVSGAQLVTDLFWPRHAVVTESAVLAMEEFQLEPVLSKSPGNISYGKRRLSAVARALAADPAVLLLDEPAAGLDATERREFGDLVRTVAQRWNIGILLVEHDVEMVFRTCDRVVALVEGAVVATGSPAEVRRNETLIEAYLGQAATRDRASERTDTGIGGNANLISKGHAK